MKLIKPLPIIILFSTVFLFACEKEYPSIEELDEKNIQEYIQKNGLNMQADSSGIYYQILNPGTGAQIKDTDKVFFTYREKTFNGEYINDNEQVNRYSDFLGYLAGGSAPKGWHPALKNILRKKGGSIRVITPSRLAYGRNGRGKIPGNASIDATLTLYDASTQTEFEDVFVKKFINEMNITGLTRTSSGLYYQIITPGTGEYEVYNDTRFEVIYTGRHADGIVFEKTNSPVKLTLTNMIEGWKQGLPLIKKGGKIRLIIPPALAYGEQGSSGSIKPNEVLDFDIELKDVTN